LTAGGFSRSAGFTSIGWRSEHCHDADQPGGFDVGDEPVLINEVDANFESWDAHKKNIEFHVGPIGFSLATSANCRT
jgi:hypothetical protein